MEVAGSDLVEAFDVVEDSSYSCNLVQIVDVDGLASFRSLIAIKIRGKQDCSQ